MIDPAVDLLLRLALTLLFAVSAWDKAADLPAFRRVLDDYRVLPTAAVPTVAAAVTIYEGFLAAMLLAPVLPPLLRMCLPSSVIPALSLPTSSLAVIAAIAACCLLATYTAAVVVNLMRGRRHIDCGCGGPALSQPIGNTVVVRNICLLVMAAMTGLPVGLRPLVALDVFTAAAAFVATAVLYTAAEQAHANLPMHRRLGGMS